MSNPRYQNKVKQFERRCDAPPDYTFTVKYGAGGEVAVPPEGVVLFELNEAGEVVPNAHKVLSREDFEALYEEVPAP